MKIISPYKDFYDFKCGPVPDTTNTYVRRPEMIRLTEAEYVGSGLEAFMKANCYYSVSFWSSTNYAFQGYILGIYPNIYIINTAIPPLFKIEINKPQYDECGKPAYVIPNNMLADTKKIEETFGVILGGTPFANKKDGVGLKYTYGRFSSGSKYINTVIEKPEFFKLLGCPVFLGPIMYANYDSDTYYAAVFYGNPNLCELNKKFVGLFNCIKELDPYIDDTIYDRIENYLYSSKVEPIAEPDNKTRIVNAGFDLKTSFRNVK